MSKVRFDITVTLDGYVAGPEQSEANPLGVGADHIHDWLLKLKSFREMHGDTGGGEEGTNDDILRDAFAGIGATIMGRNMFGPVRGPWGDGSWRGWWGAEPPFHHPVFVLTHHARETLHTDGGTTFTFVTDGIESALEQAWKAADGRDVAIGGGADVARQYLAAGLVDEMQLHVVPLLLGGGERLFDGLTGADVRLMPVRTVEAPDVAHLKYRIVR
jgi:dihydrofolate reductase